MSSESSKAYAVGIRLLSRREHSIREIEDKLTSKGFDVSVVQMVIDKLVDQGYLSQTRFARSFLSMRISQGKGPLLIHQEMSYRGVTKELIEEVEVELGVDWLEQASEVIRRKCKGAVPGDFREKSKLVRHLASRGFSLSVAQQALKALEADFL